jgi:hypothetical protein
MACRHLDRPCFNFLEKFSRKHAKQCSMQGSYYLEAANDEPAEKTRWKT